MRGAAATLLVLLALALPPAAHAQEEGIRLPRHTPGFPEAATIDIAKLVELLDAAHSALSGANSFEELRSNPPASEAVAEAVEAAGAAGALPPDEVAALRDVLQGASTEELLSAINDPELLSALLKILRESNTGSLSLEDLASVYQLAQALLAEGRIGPGEYAAAMEIVRRLAHQSGYSSLEAAADRSLIEALTGTLSWSLQHLGSADLATWGLEGASRLLTAATELGRLPGVVPESLDELSGGLRSAPSLPSLPEAPLEDLRSALLVVGGVLAAVLAAYLGAKVARALAPRIRLASLAVQRASKKVPEDMPKPVRVYWVSVELAKILTGIGRGEAQTHREYLSEVKPRLGRAAEPFEEITRVYEEYRFAGLRSPELEARAEKAYARMRARLHEG